MTGVGVAFGVGLAVTGAYAFASPQRGPSLLAWSFLVIGWIATVLIAPYGAEFVWIWPICDAVFGTLAMAIAVRRKAYWAAILALLFFGQCVTHVAWNVMQVCLPTDEHRIYRYFASINALLVAQMVAVSWPGGTASVTVLLRKLHGLLRDRDNERVA